MSKWVKLFKTSFPEQLPRHAAASLQSSHGLAGFQGGQSRLAVLWGRAWASRPCLCALLSSGSTNSILRESLRDFRESRKARPLAGQSRTANLKFPSSGPGCTLLDLHDLLEFPRQMTGGDAEHPQPHPSQT